MRRSQPNLTIDDFAVEESPHALIESPARDELARELGYPSIRQMMEQTEIVLLTSGLHMYLTTDSDGYWVAWSDQPFYDVRRFTNRLTALAELHESIDPILMQS